MAMLRYQRYPNAFSPTTALQPQGGFKNRSAPEALDGTYLEKDWANDWSGFFSSLLVRAGITPNGLVDNATASQYFDAMMALINNATLSRTGDTVGSIQDFPMDTPPAGFLVANGAAARRADFPALFARIGVTFGGGDGATTFNLPDLRGTFSRALDLASGRDPGRVISPNPQASQNISHTHTATTDTQGAHAHYLNIDAAGVHNHTAATDAAGEHTHTTPIGGTYTFAGNDLRGLTPGTGVTGSAGNHVHTVRIDSNGGHTHSGVTQTAPGHVHNVTVAASGGNESRPLNMALLRCIKY